MLLRSRCITSALNWKRAMQPGPDPLCPVIVSDKRAMGISPLGPGARSSVLWQRVNDKRALEIDSRGRYVHQTDPLEKSRNVFFFFSFFVPPPPPLFFLFLFSFFSFSFLFFFLFFLFSSSSDTCCFLLLLFVFSFIQSRQRWYPVRGSKEESMNKVVWPNDIGLERFRVSFLVSW